MLQPNDKYTYVIQSYQEEKDTLDAPRFSATIHINLQSEEEARQWVDEMSEHSKCTYRVTKTVKPAMKRVKCKLVMHCQHYAKKLTQRQMAHVCTSQSTKGKSTIAFSDTKQENGLPIPLYSSSSDPNSKATPSSRIRALFADSLWSAKIGLQPQPSHTCSTYIVISRCVYRHKEGAVWPLRNGTQCCISKACLSAANTARVKLTCRSTNCACRLSFQSKSTRYLLLV